MSIGREARLGLLGILAPLFFALTLPACQSQTTRVAARTSATSTEGSQISAVDTTGSTHYAISSAASTVHILVYRGGAMARLGHNHALSSQSVTGDLHLHPDLSKTQLRLSLPVASLDVDDAAVRATEGEDFAASVPQDAREGTKRNLLRADVLDAEHFPTIDLQASAVAGTRNAPQLTMRIALKGVTRELLVPVTVEESGSTLVAAGEFSIKQTDFGITPFSVALGALQVQDAVRIRFRLVAEKK